MPLNDPDDPFDSPVTLSSDGKLEGPAAPKDQRRPPESWTRPDAPLELDQVGHRAAPEPAAPDEAALARAATQRQRRQLAIMAAGIVLLGALAALFLLQAPAPANPPEAAAGQSAPAAPAVSTSAPAPAAAPAPSATAAPVAIAAPADGAAAAFTVQSEPPGASVFIGDELLGTTPFLGTNDTAPGGQTKIRLELRGYLDWTGAVPGGRNVNLVARLKRK